MADRNSSTYLTARNDLLGANEGNVLNLYFDTIGVPTIGKGYALITQGNATDRKWHIDPNRVSYLSDVLEHTTEERAQFKGLMESVAEAKETHKTQAAIGKHKAFVESDLGKAEAAVVGTIDQKNNRAILTSDDSPMQVSITEAQSTLLFNNAVTEKENILDSALKSKNCPQEAVSESQRAALVSMVYHGRTSGAKTIAGDIGKYYRGEITEEALKTSIDTNLGAGGYGARGTRESELLKDLAPVKAQTLQPAAGASLTGDQAQQATQTASVSTPINNQAVTDLQQTLHTGLSEPISKAGAGAFVEPMVAATTLACVEQGLTAQTVDTMGINSKTNTIFAGDKWGTHVATVDAFAAAQVNPQETLQAASQLQENLGQQQEQSQQLAQQQQQSKNMNMA